MTHNLTVESGGRFNHVTIYGPDEDQLASIIEATLNNEFFFRVSRDPVSLPSVPQSTGTFGVRTHE